MSTAGIPESTTDFTPAPGTGTKTLSVKNVPHAVWQRARQNALASNLSFGDYVVKMLEKAGPVQTSKVSTKHENKTHGSLPSPDHVSRLSREEAQPEVAGMPNRQGAGDGSLE